MDQFCTITNFDYLDRVLALDESRRTWCKESLLHILVLDEHSSGHLEHLTRSGFMEGIELWHWGDMISQELRDTRINRSYEEWVWTLKPYWILHLMRVLPRWTELTYVDGDMAFFNRPASMFDELRDFDIGITPHRFSQSFEHYKVNGEFNGGFVHVKNTRNALDCIAHWGGQCLKRCSLQCTDDSFVDQKYLNTWPDRWGARSLQHKGVNLAPYNQGGDHYTYKWINEHIMVDDQPLVLYHFHGGPTTAYPLDPFIREHVYRPRIVALERAQGAIRTCGF